MKFKRNEVIAVVVVLFLAFAVLGIFMVENKVNRDVKAADRHIENILGSDGERDRLAREYYEDGKTKKEAIRLLMDRGYSRSQAEIAVENTW